MYKRLFFIILFFLLIFPAKSHAFTIEKVYKITRGDVQQISAEIQFFIYEKEYEMVIKEPNAGYYNFHGCSLGYCSEHNYVITTVKKIDDDVYLYTKNSYNGSTYKNFLLKHLKKNGFKYEKVKDEDLLEKLAIYSNKVMSDKKIARFFPEEKNTKVTPQPPQQPIIQHAIKTKQGPVSVKQLPQINLTDTGREISKAGNVFNKVKDGVATIVSTGNGSGFLVDPKGLILTNYHVVKTVEDSELRIRFGQDQIVSGKIIVKDPRNDVAVIWANLQNIKNYKILKLAYPKPGSPLVLMGEKVLAIGSPLEWETLEKTLTQGVVSKCDESVIMHDANIDGGNSGGPLLNFGGEVVGINTFHPAGSRGLSGSVAISRAYKALNEAQQKISTITLPSPDLFPDVNKAPYTFEMLEKAYCQSTKKTKKRDEPYRIGATTDFDIYLYTPALKYRMHANRDERSIKRFKKRQEKYSSGVSDEDYESKGLPDHYYNKPVVQVIIWPKPELTKASAGFNLLSAAGGITAAALTGVYVPTPTYKNYTFDKDFQKLTLLNKTTGEIYTPYLGGKELLTADMEYQYGFNYEKINEKTYVGFYEYDPRIFETSGELAFNLYYSDHKPPITRKIKNKIKGYIIEDFEPYWHNIENINNSSNI